jgi:hypothetical protein
VGWRGAAATAERLAQLRAADVLHEEDLGEVVPGGGARGCISRSDAAQRGCACGT